MRFEWPAYVPVAERRRKAEQKVAKLKKQGRVITPVVIAGKKIAATVWGQAWCDNLERYSDYESRLPKGKTYVRNGSVVDLQIAPGMITAMVAGSELYDIRVTIPPVAKPRWNAICRDCAGAIDSLVELLQGRLAKGVMDRVCRAGDGLFPAPTEIKLSCSCPDGASMCKHVAATLYGVGARLDDEPELLFLLRGVAAKDLVAEASKGGGLTRGAPVPDNALAGDDLAALFGLDMAGDVPPPLPPVTERVPAVLKPAVLKRVAKAKPAIAPLTPPPVPARARTMASEETVRKAAPKSPAPVWTPADIVARPPPKAKRVVKVARRKAAGKP